MAYLVYDNKEAAEAARSKRDKELGYPEPLESLRWVGNGRHCPKEFGRALHYCRLVENKDSAEFAIKDVDGVSVEIGASKTTELSWWHKYSYVDKDGNKVDTIEEVIDSEKDLKLK